MQVNGCTPYPNECVNISSAIYSVPGVGGKRRRSPALHGFPCALVHRSTRFLVPSGLGRSQADLEYHRTYSPNQVILLQRPYAGTPTSSCDQNAQVKAAGIRNVLFYNYFDDVATRPLPLVTTEGFPFDWLDGVGYVDNALGSKLAGLVSSGNRITLDLPWKPENDTRIPRLMKNDISGVSAFDSVLRRTETLWQIKDLTHREKTKIYVGFHVELQHMGTNV